MFPMSMLAITVVAALTLHSLDAGEQTVNPVNSENSVQRVTASNFTNTSLTRQSCDLSDVRKIVAEGGGDPLRLVVAEGLESAWTYERKTQPVDLSLPEGFSARSFRQGEPYLPSGASLKSGEFIIICQLAPP